MTLPAQSTRALAQGQLGLTRWPGAEPELLALHGFTGSGLDFAPLVEHLPQALLAPDLPGHGATRLAPSSFADAVEALAAALPSEGAVLLGYSFGGRLALQWALAQPARFRALILVGATPGLADPEDRATRAAADEALAAQIEREGVAPFQAEWSRRPLIASQARIAPRYLAAMRARREANDPAGLALALRALGTGVMPPCWDALAGLRLPTLLLTGAEDAKFTALAARMRASLPRAEHVTLPEAGHCAHLEQPARAAEAVLRFLAQMSDDP